MPMLQTPTAVMTCESPENMRARAKAKGYQNGTQYGSLESQLNYDPRFKGLLPTTQAMDYADVRGKMGKNDKLVETPSGLRRVIQTGSDFGVSLGFMANNGLLPTPTVVDNPHPHAMIDSTGKRISKEGSASHSQGLSDLAHHGLLPTPTARDEKNPSSPDGERIARKMEQGWTIELNDLAAMRMLLTPHAGIYKTAGGSADYWEKRKGKGHQEDLSMRIYDTLKDCDQAKDGNIFRLSPLFTQEMMGFPLGWTELPFLSGNGEPRR